MVLSPNGKVVKDQARAIFEHLIVCRGCANGYYESGRCGVFDGKEVVLDSVHVRHKDHTYYLRAADRFGKPVSFGKTINKFHALRKAALIKRCKRLNTQESAWRG